MFNGCWTGCNLPNSDIYQLSLCMMTFKMLVLVLFSPKDWFGERWVHNAAWNASGYSISPTAYCFEITVRSEVMTAVNQHLDKLQFAYKAGRCVNEAKPVVPNLFSLNYSTGHGIKSCGPEHDVKNEIMLSGFNKQARWGTFVGCRLGTPVLSCLYYILCTNIWSNQELMLGFSLLIFFLFSLCSLTCWQRV